MPELIMEHVEVLRVRNRALAAAQAHVTAARAALADARLMETLAEGKLTDAHAALRAVLLPEGDAGR